MRWTSAARSRRCFIQKLLDRISAMFEGDQNQKESRVPHVIVKLWPGKSEQQKTRLAEAITKDVIDILHYGEESVSVVMEEVKSQDWVEKVYRPDVGSELDKLYKKPGYDENDL